jgi:hypothetical protein
MCARSHVKLYLRCESPNRSVEKLEEDFRGFNYSEKTSTPAGVEQYSARGYVRDGLYPPDQRLM